MDARPPQIDPTEAAALQHMIHTQLTARDIRSAMVLEAIASVPRSNFVGDGQLRRAYEDAALPIDAGQTISQPYIVAKMTELLELQGRERVLEIGTGSGYQSAVLARIAREVYTIEYHEALSAQARARHATLGIENVHYRVGDGSAGWPEAAPFDGILVTAAGRVVPPPLFEQLAEGGRMIAPVGEPGDQHLVRYVRTIVGVTEHRILACRFVPLLGKGIAEPGRSEPDQPDGESSH